MPPTPVEDSTYASAAQAAAAAYKQAGLARGAQEVDYFSLYDCFPVCFIRCVAALVGFVGSV